MKYLHIYFLIILFISVGCSKKTNSQKEQNPEIIPVDINKEEKINGTSLIDTSYFEIIPLEANEQCLISNVSKIWLRGDKIIVYDENLQGTFIFNRDGSFHAKVHALGNGPGEYPSAGVNDVVVTQNYVSIFSPVTNKIFLYDFDGNFLKTILLKGTWGYTFFTFDERNYHIVNGNSQSKVGLFHFYTLDSKTDNVKSFLPFGQQKIDSKQGWMLQNYYSKNQDHALIIYCSNDTIYEFTPPDKLVPKYYVNILTKKIPPELAEKDGHIALEHMIQEKYVTIKGIKEYSRYLIFFLSPDYRLIYDKQTKETTITSKPYSIREWNFGFSFLHNVYAENDTLLMNYDAETIGFLKPYLNRKDFSSPRFEKRYFEVMNNVEEDSNPVVFIFKLKGNE